MMSQRRGIVADLATDPSFTLTGFVIFFATMRESEYIREGDLSRPASRRAMAALLTVHICFNSDRLNVAEPLYMRWAKWTPLEMESLESHVCTN